MSIKIKESPVRAAIILIRVALTGLCLIENDQEGVMEIVEDYLYALNKSNNTHHLADPDGMRGSL